MKHHTRYGRSLLGWLCAVAAVMLVLARFAAQSPADALNPVAARLDDTEHTNGVFAFGVTGITGQTYRIEASTDLAGWTVLGTNEALPKQYRFADGLASNFARRFYRCVFVPDAADTTPPTWPVATLTVSNVTPDSLTLHWSAAKDDRNVLCYGIYLDGVLVATVGGDRTQTTVSGLAPGREYAAVVQACDAGGHVTSSGPARTVHSALAPEPARNSGLGVASGDSPGGVLLHSGELTLQRTDLHVRGRRMGFTFRRTYRSGRDADGPLGFGWDADVFMKVTRQANGDICWHAGRGLTRTFAANGDGTYRSPTGIYARAKSDGSGTRIRRPNGFVYAFDSNGLVTAWSDRAGNRVTFVRDAQDRLTQVVDEFGRTILFVYDGNSRLKSMTDFTGREVRYNYGPAGDLTEVRSPVVTGTPNGNDFPAGRTERYVYDSAKGDPRLAHNLVAVVAPNEVANGTATPRLQTVYGDSSHNYDRVLTQTVGGINTTGVGAGGVLTYVYDPAPPGGPAGTRTRTTVTDRNGTVSAYDYDADGHVLCAVRDSGGVPATTFYTYNGDGELTAATHPLGNRTIWTHDASSPDRFQQGNLLSVRRTPDGVRGGDQAIIETRYTYEPLYVQPRTETDPLGHVTTHTYDYQENAQAPTGAADWDITVPGALLGLGDVNADGITTQTMGSLVRVDEPTVELTAGSNQAAAEGDTSQEIVSRYSYNGIGQLVRQVDARGNTHVYLYHPENDPDGDGQNLIPGGDPATGGYLRGTVRDALAGPGRLDTAPLARVTRRYGYDRAGRVVAVTDPNSNTTVYVYNALDERVQAEAPKIAPVQAHGYLVRYAYDASGNRVAVDVENGSMDRTNHVPERVAGHPFFLHRFTYDILDRLIERRLDATRDASIPPTTQPEWLTYRYAYDANGNQTRLQSPLAVAGDDPHNVVAYEYDALNRVIVVTRGLGSIDASTRRYAYDANGNRTGVTDADGHTHVRSYDGYDRLGGETDRCGARADHAYDALGRRTRTELHGPPDGGGGTNVLLSGTDHAYDQAGRLVALDHDLFIPADTTVSSAVRVTEGTLVPGDGKLNARYEYDALGRLTFELSDDGHVTEHAYDGAGRRIRTQLPLTDPGGAATRTEWRYDAAGNPIVVTETHSCPAGLVQTQAMPYLYVYDPLNRLVRETDPRGWTRYMEYDGRDNLVTRYDARGTPMTDPLGLYPAGINDYGNPVRYDYDGIGRLWQTVTELHEGGDSDMPVDTGNPYNADGLVTVGSVFDANSRLVARSDDPGNVTLYEYDSLNRLVRRVHPDGGTRNWQHDGDDCVVEMRDENNTVHTYTYDDADRLTRHVLVADPSKRIVGDALPFLMGTTVQAFEHDGRGLITRSMDNNEPAGGGADDAVVVNVYDSIGRLVEERQNGLAVGSRWLSDDRTAIVYPGAGRVVHHAYDAMGQLIGASNTTDLAVRTDYLGACMYRCGAPRHRCSMPVQREFNAQGWTAMTHRVARDDVGLVFEGHALLTGGDSTQSVVRTRDAHDAYRGDSTHVGLSNQSWVYLSRDSVGAGSDGDTSEDCSVDTFHSQYLVFSYNGARALREANGFGDAGAEHYEFPRNSVQENGYTGFTYNASVGTGLRTADTNFVYQWDGLDRLRVVRSAANPETVIATYRYDADTHVFGGRRVSKAVTNSGALNGTVQYVWDGANEIEEYALDGGARRLSRQFIYGDGADDVLAMDVDSNADGDPDTLYFYLMGENNNVAQIASAGGMPVEFYTYDLLGLPRIRSAADGWRRTTSLVGNPYMFAARRYEPETGLYYFRARYFDPRVGEFLSRDPLGIWGDPSSHGNGFAYAANSPQTDRDPTGLQGPQTGRPGVKPQDPTPRPTGGTSASQQSVGSASAQATAHAQAGARASMCARGSVSAKAYAEANITPSPPKPKGAMYGVGGVDVDINASARGKAHVEATAEAKGKVSISGDRAVVEGKAGAFAGVRAEGDVKLGVDSPFSVKAKGRAWAGAGVGAGPKMGYDKGKLKFSANLGAALGVGAGGKVEVEVDVKKIADMAAGAGAKLDLDDVFDAGGLPDWELSPWHGLDHSLSCHGCSRCSPVPVR